jgi:hypothetical protein
MAVGVLMRVVVVCERTSPTTQPVSVRTGVGMAVLKAAVSVQGSLVHRPHDTNDERSSLLGEYCAFVLLRVRGMGVATLVLFAAAIIVRLEP